MQLYSFTIRKMNLITVFVFHIYICTQSGIFGQKASNMKPCPEFFSKYTDSVDRLLGNWHIALLILDETEEVYEERSVCLEGRLLKVNASLLIQTWNVALPELLHLEHTEIDFPTTILEPGIWLVHSPLGGQIQGTILESDGESYLLIVYCDIQENNLFHMMTVAMSRGSTTTPEEKLHFLSLLRRNGYDPYENKIVSWSNC